MNGDDDPLLTVKNENYNVRQKPKTFLCNSGREGCCFFAGFMVTLALCSGGLILYTFLNEAPAQNKHSATVPSPVNVTNITTGPSFLYLSWDPPSSGSHMITISEYTIQYANSSNLLTENISWISTTSPFTNQNLSMLHASTEYIFRVRAENDFGASNWSSIYKEKTLSPVKPMPPTSPVLVNVKPTSNNSQSVPNTVEATVLINLVGDGGSLIRKVVIEAKAIADINFTVFCTTNVNGYEKPANTPQNCTGKIITSSVVQFRASVQNSVGSSGYTPITPCVIPEASLELFMCEAIVPPETIESVQALHSGTNDITIGSKLRLKLFLLFAYIGWDKPFSQLSAPILGYEVERDDWWNSTRLQNVSLPDKGISLTSNWHNLLPGVPYHGRVRAQNKFGWSDWSKIITATTANKGACGNLADLQQWKKYYNELQKDIKTIFLECMASPNKRNCASKKIQQLLGFSEACSECWVDDGICTMLNCGTSCLNPKSTKCLKCSQEKCIPKCAQCAGLPLFVFPP
eukprot:m.187723 g.187723  ORF g.187723 m.187723 type:complete len:518 (-) comp15612_c0_seq10:2463-4016(-)